MLERSFIFTSPLSIAFTSVVVEIESNVAAERSVCLNSNGCSASAPASATVSYFGDLPFANEYYLRCLRHY